MSGDQAGSDDGGTVRALALDTTSLVRTAAVAAGTRVHHDMPWGRAGLLSLRHLEPPTMPEGDGWVRIRPTLAGICGSDLKLLHVGFSPVLSAYNPATRAVPGHELVGVVEAAGPGVRRCHEGDRVLVDPVAGCVAKGLPVCRRCAAGDYQLCERLPDAGRACAGQGLGFTDRLGGGWSEAVLAHESQCYPIDEQIPDKRAVLGEPAAVALHAVLRWSGRPGHAVVIGPGTVGLLVTAALRHVRPESDVTVVCAGAFGESWARRVGAHATVSQPPAAALETVAARLGARLLRPRVGRLPVLDGGADVVFDCIGTASTLDLAARLLRARGELVLVGTAGRTRFDWSLVWFRELSVHGSLCYSEEAALGGRRTFDVVRDWLADSAGRLDGLVTHTFPLERYADALSTAAAGPAECAVKVAFVP